MQQVRAKAGFKQLRGAGFKAYAIIATGIVDQAIESPIAAGDLFNDLPALICFRKLRNNYPSYG